MMRILIAGRQGPQEYSLYQFYRLRGPNSTLVCPYIGNKYRTENLSYLTLVDVRKSYSSLREVIPMREEPTFRRQEVLPQEILVIPEEELMKGLERLGVIRELSRKNPEWKHKELFRLLRKEDIWINAYENIKGVLDGIGLARLQKVQKKVLEENSDPKATEDQLNEVNQKITNSEAELKAAKKDVEEADTLYKNEQKRLQAYKDAEDAALACENREAAVEACG